jgi:ribonuclease VapC
MISSCVFDSSAVLALLFQERGAERVVEQCSTAVLSTVSYSECLAKATDRGFPLHDAVRMLEALPMTVVPFDTRTAIIASSFRTATRHSDYSFADRACLATASVRGLPVLTADKAWREMDLGVEVVLIR